LSGGFVGLFISGGSHNIIQGNKIGTDLSGEFALNTSGYGVLLVNGASDNLIGGTDPAAPNIISGNRFDATYPGFSCGQGPANNNRVEGNYIGVDATGFNALPNSIGVSIQSGSTGNFVGGGSSGSGTVAPGASSAGNVISGNRNWGVLITDRSSGNAVQGNKIGTTAQGNQGLAHASSRVGHSGRLDHPVRR